MTQFTEPKNTKGKCPICGKEVLIRSTRGKASYCSRACASMRNYSLRYKGTNAGPMDRPNLKDKTKLPV